MSTTIVEAPPLTGPDLTCQRAVDLGPIAMATKHLPKIGTWTVDGHSGIQGQLSSYRDAEVLAGLATWAEHFGTKVRQRVNKHIPDRTEVWCEGEIDDSPVRIWASIATTQEAGA